MIRILTDSACDILPAEAQQLGVTVIPLNVTLEDGTVLRDGIDMTPSEYYTHLAACRKLPTTSQPSPEQFERLYLDAAAAGDEVLGIFFSDALSGTGQCAKIAADLANVDNVVFVNTENVCLGQSLLVRLAVQLRDAGKTITQIAADLEKAKQHLHLVAAVDDLKYLRKGGRLSAAAAVAGGMLGIKPILAVIEGKVALAGKARGLPGVYVGGNGLMLKNDTLSQMADRDPDRFRWACRFLGGEPWPAGDIGFRIPLFCDLSAVLKFYHSDEEFPAQLTLLWDRNTLRFVRYETVYYIAGVLMSRLKTLMGRHSAQK